MASKFALYVFIMTLLTLQGCALPKEKNIEHTKARSVVVNGKGLPVYEAENSVLSVKILLEKMEKSDPGVYVGKMTLHKGARVSPHSHSSSDEILLITEGEGEMILGKEFVDVGPDSVVFIAKGTLHSFRVKGNKTVKIVQIYNPSGPEQRFKKWSLAEESSQPEVKKEVK